MGRQPNSPTARWKQGQLFEATHATEQEWASLVDLLKALLEPNEAEKTATSLLSRYGDFNRLAAASLDQLLNDDSITVEVARLIYAARKLSAQACLKRVYSEPIIQSSKFLLEYLAHVYSDSEIRSAHAIFLNTKNRMLGEEIFAIGEENSLTIPIKPIVRRALGYHATSLIFSGNHPSGDPTPYTEDIEFFKRSSIILGLLEITVQDFIIMGNGQCYSMKRRQLIEFSIDEQSFTVNERAGRQLFRERVWSQDEVVRIEFKDRWDFGTGIADCLERGPPSRCLEVFGEIMGRDEGQDVGFAGRGGSVSRYSVSAPISGFPAG